MKEEEAGEKCRWTVCVCAATCMYIVCIFALSSSPSSPPLPSHAGVDPRPAVFGVVGRVPEGTEDLSHTDQQVRGHSLLSVNRSERMPSAKS